MSTVDHRLHHVVSGLKLVYASILVVVLTVFVNFGLALLLGNGWAINPMIFVLIVGGMGLLSSLLAIVGMIYCLDVPEKVKATRYIYAAVGLTVAGTLVSLANNYMSLGAIYGQLASWMTMAGYVHFLVFLRRLAEFLDAPRSVSWANFVLYGWFALAAIGFGLILILPQMIGGGALTPAVFLVVWITGAIFGLVLFISYANLVNQLRRRLESHLVGRSLD